MSHKERLNQEISTIKSRSVCEMNPSIQAKYEGLKQELAKERFEKQQLLTELDSVRNFSNTENFSSAVQANHTFHFERLVDQIEKQVVDLNLTELNDQKQDLRSHMLWNQETEKLNA